MAQPVPRLSIPAALALGSAALGAAFATGLLLGELDWAAAVPGMGGGRGAEQSEMQALTRHPLPGRETVASMGVQATRTAAAT